MHDFLNFSSCSVGNHPMPTCLPSSGEGKGKRAHDVTTSETHSVPNPIFLIASGEINRATPSSDVRLVQVPLPIMQDDDILMEGRPEVWGEDFGRASTRQRTDVQSQSPDRRASGPTVAKDNESDDDL